MNYKDNLCSSSVPVYPVEELSMEEALAVMACNEEFRRFAAVGHGTDAEDSAPAVPGGS